MKRLVFLTIIILLVSISSVYAEETVVYFFWGNGCPHCAAEKPFIEDMQEKYADLVVQSIEVSSQESAQLFNSMAQAYGTSAGGVPMTFVGDEFFVGYGNYDNTGIFIEEAIANCVENGCIDPLSKIETNSETDDISLIQLLSLAMVDAINPCELAVLVILMTAILTKFPKNKNKALKSGLSFSAAIFIMYLFFGILLITGFKFVTGFTQLSGMWFYKLLAGFAILMGLLNIKDAIWYGGGGFIMEVPMRWRPKMKEIINGTTSIGGAFIVGLIVSFFLTPCTGGPYFVAGGILSEMALITAIPYLLIYMCVFISPMIAITLIVYFGFMAVEDIGGWREKNLKKLHWVAGLLMLGMGIAMLMGWL
ncbi:MAG: redoxin family protein [Candidatus Aenigmarchaeota archaeon]|nr:redoxin family protein [Candidatus Aenigmarchaeota archaeon]